MVFVEKMKSMKIYKQPCFLPTAEGNKKKDSAVILLTPSYESSKNLMNNSMFINKKRFESYFLDRDVSYYIGNKKLEEVDESFLYLEETKRSELKDSDFGIPEDRKFPLDTEEHVRSAIKLFGHAEESKKKSLAKRISRKASKYGIKIPDTTQCYKYLHEAIVEAFQPAEEDDNLDFKFSVPGTDIIDIKFEMDEKEKRWNSIVLVEGVAPKTLRGRSECLVIKDDMIYLDETESGICSKGGIAEIMYDVPGGGWDPNEPHDICAIRETNEEAKIDVKDVQYIDNYLTIDKVRPEGCYCDGLFSEVYIGKYAGKYTGPVADVDRADIAVSGSWYPIDEVYDKLNPIHKKAIDIYFGREPELAEFESPVDESVFIIENSIQKSELDDNFKKKSISDINYEVIDFHSPNAKKYIETDSYLSNLYNKNKLKDFNGEIIVDKDNGTVIGRVFVGTGKDEGYIGALRVYDKYKGYGFGDILIKDAINKYGGYDLNVFKDNEVALKMYKNYGFEVVNTDSSDDSYYMKLKSKMNEAYIEEGVFMNKKDAEFNLSSWKPNDKNILFITGLSGSGKSTKAAQLAKENDAVNIELDLVEHNDILFDDSVTQDEGNQILKEFFKKKFGGPKKLESKSMDVPQIMYEAIKYCMKYANDNKGKLFIAEGIQLMDLEMVDELKGYPVIVVNTSIAKSILQAKKREEGSSWKEFFGSWQSFKEYCKWYFNMEKNKNKFIKDMKESYDYLQEGTEFVLET